MVGHTVPVLDSELQLSFQTHLANLASPAKVKEKSSWNNGTHLLIEINEEKHRGDPLGCGGRLLPLPARQAQRLLGSRNQPHHVLNRYKLLSSLLPLPARQAQRLLGSRNQPHHVLNRCKYCLVPSCPFPPARLIAS
jgi:hypothetical protein